ncbi:MAG TPA: phosphopantetheine-binding protein [Polyangia bacterium]|jgi:acyl carrier protein
MSVTAEDVLHRLHEFLAGQGLPPQSLAPETRLYADGLGLDSFAAAELSVHLERHLGRDPYATGPWPRTVGDILAFFSREARS